MKLDRERLFLLGNFGRISITAFLILCGWAKMAMLKKKIKPLSLNDYNEFDKSMQKTNKFISSKRRQN